MKSMHIVRSAAVLALLITWMVGCSDGAQQTEVKAVVAPHFSHEGLEAGDPLAGATLRLYRAETVVLETELDEAGTALIEPEPGSYDVQVQLSATDPLCFWGETVFGVAFPSPPLTLEAGFICAGE